MSARVTAGWIAASILVFTTGCASGHPRLVAPGEGGWFGYTMFDMEANEPFTIEGFRLCLDRPGRVEITDVSLEYSVSGLRVDAFAVKPADEPLLDPDSDRVAVWEYGFEEGAVTVDLVCAPEIEDAPDQVRLGVQFSKPTEATARGANLLVTYVSEDRTKTLREEFELILCEGKATEPEWAEECDDWPTERYEGYEVER